VVDGVADTPNTPGGRDRTSRTSARGRGSDPADEQIIRRVVAGDQLALAELYDRWSKQAFSLARRVCADEGLAEDVFDRQDPSEVDPCSRVDERHGLCAQRVPDHDRVVSSHQLILKIEVVEALPRKQRARFRGPFA
jgi:hypothetical protein